MRITIRIPIDKWHDPFFVQLTQALQQAGYDTTLSHSEDTPFNDPQQAVIMDLRAGGENDQVTTHLIKTIAPNNKFLYLIGGNRTEQECARNHQNCFLLNSDASLSDIVQSIYHHSPPSPNHEEPFPHF